VDGKFFRRGAGKLYLKGVTYGPFAPEASPDGSGFASAAQTARDFALVRELGANLLRVYRVPPPWLLDLAAAHDLLLLIDIPWNKHLCFLDSAAEREAARAAVRAAARQCARHPAVFALSVANEIPPDVVRWSGAGRVAEFIDELVLEAKRIDPDGLCTFANYPPTEFLHPQATDFTCFNVYLHQPQPFRNYLARLQMKSGDQPLVLGEFGIDSLREGEAAKCAMLEWQIELAFRAGLAGAVVFSFTDDWHHSGRQIDDWKMGLTTEAREPKESFRVVQRMFRAAPYFALPAARTPTPAAAADQGADRARCPKVSVIVAAYNADRTLQPCLESLGRLNYPDYEVILVDDGSTDMTSQIAAQAERGALCAPSAGGEDRRTRRDAPGPRFVYLRHERNLGLSAARNTGLAAAAGEIIAFTDADCRADEDWLYYLVGDLLNSEFAGMGGPNLLPPEDSAVAAAVMVSPGGPAHVMLDDRQAEHVPGCNMAFYQWALAAVGGFDPLFTQAGDDVDLCWRLQQAGCKIGFSPAAFVWHYRRSTVGAYLRQQRGYGEAEALLARKHPEYFNSFGGSIWRGRIYTPASFGVRLRQPVIYHGVFGSAPFQTLYASAPAFSLMLCTTLEYHVLVTLPLWALAAPFRPLLPLAVTSLLLSVAVCAASGAQASLPRNKKRWWSRPLVALLFFLQPIVRGWARYAGRLRLRPLAGTALETLDSVALRDSGAPLDEVRYWTDRRVERAAFVARVIEELNRRGWPNRADIGWSEFDVEIYGSRWAHLQLTTAAEDHPRGRQLIRCRLRARPSLFARVLFWSALGLEALVTGVVGGWPYWLGLTLLTLAASGYVLAREKRNLQSVVIVFLDGLAKDWGWIHVPADGGAKAAAHPAPARGEPPPAGETPPK
jgi:GT2 family glycosyltransferase